MLISHAFRFIYTKTLKTAGTSVEIYFEDACIPQGFTAPRGHRGAEIITPAGIIGYRGPDRSGSTWFNHMPASLIRETIGRDIWDAYFKFCVVRNPFDKMVSLWWFVVNSRHEYPHVEKPFSEIRSDFSRFCVEHAGNAVDRDKYMIDGKVAVDQFIRYETLMTDLHEVCREINFPFQPERLGRYKAEARAQKRPFAEYYDTAAIAAVERAFAWELANLNYTGPAEWQPGSAGG